VTCNSYQRARFVLLTNVLTSALFGVIRTLEEIKTSLDVSDMTGVVANNWKDLLNRSDNAKKGDVLKKWQDAT
jgi:hypothetical protein